MKTKLVVVSTLMICLIACDKESNQTDQKKSDLNYFPLTTGNYWVYNTYSIDSMGQEKIIRENDTVVIIGDTVIQGNHYKVFQKSKVEITLYRDSLDYIVNEKGKIVLSTDNYTDTLYSFLYPEEVNLNVYSIMETYSETVSLPAGIFDSILNCKFYAIQLLPDKSIIRINNNLYAPNVGSVLKQYFYLQQYLHEKIYYEERLISYYIVPSETQ